MRSILKLSALALSILSIAACNSSDSDEESAFALQRHLPMVDAFDLQISNGDLLLTTQRGMLYRLPANSDEWEPLFALQSSNPGFVFTPTAQQYAMTTFRIPTFSISNDGGDNWDLYEGITQLPQSIFYSAMLRLDTDIYMHAGVGLHRTHLDVNRPEDSINDFEVLHNSGEGIMYPFQHRVRALVHNEARNELWWNEFQRPEDADYRVMRMDLLTDEVEQVFSLDSNPLMDGFVDDTDPNTLVFAGEGGVRISHDNGDTWTRHFMEDGIDPIAYSVQQDPVSLNYYAYVSVELDSVRTDEMWCSADQGASWARTKLAEGNDGIRNSTNAMVFLDRDGIRYFFIPTFGGLVQGALGDVAC